VLTMNWLTNVNMNGGEKLLLESMNHRQKFPRRKHMFTGPPQSLSFIRLRP
jgi:hypothetical protein